MRNNAVFGRIGPPVFGWIPLSRAKIYGASWGKSSNPVLTRTDDAIGMVANVGVDAQIVQNDFDFAQIYKDIAEITDTYGNVFVRIPKFYIKKTDTVNLKTWQISRRPFTGAYLPWCFWDFTKSQELPYIEVGKYKAGLDGSNRLTSKSGEYPLVNKNIVDFRTYAKNNGTGYQQMDVHTYDVITVLAIIELATLNVQSKIYGYATGQLNTAHTAVVGESASNRIVLSNANAANFIVGQSIGISAATWNTSVCYGRQITAINTYDASNKSIVFDGAPVNIAIGNILHNVGQKNGATDNVLSKSGSPVSNSDGKRPCKYRGIESPWGDIWQWVDGVNINEYQAWVTKNPADYASNVFAYPYQQLGYVNKNADGWTKANGFDANNPFAEFPIDNTGADGQYYSDYYYRNSGQRVARVGASWTYGSTAGPFCWALNYSSADSFVIIGGRLLKKPL